MGPKSEKIVSKVKSTGSLNTIRGGGSGKGSGPTASGTSYPAGGAVRANTNFDPRKGPRSKKTIYVGGV